MPRRFAVSVSSIAEVPSQPAPQTLLPVTSRLQSVQDVMSNSFVDLPAWFPVAKAASVLRGLGREFALTFDPRGRIGVASAADLARAPSDKTTQWCATPAGGFVTPVESVEEAWRTMVELRTERLPVKVGELIVGVVTSSALRAALMMKENPDGKTRNTHTAGTLSEDSLEDLLPAEDIAA